VSSFTNIECGGGREEDLCWVGGSEDGDKGEWEEGFGKHGEW
jgi:hypothetical protein